MTWKVATVAIGIITTLMGVIYQTSNAQQAEKNDRYDLNISDVADLKGDMKVLKEQNVQITRSLEEVKAILKNGGH